MKTFILKILFVFLIISVISQTGFSQETDSPQDETSEQKTEARLIDKFGLLECEDIWSRQDAFFVELQNYPAAVGYTVIYGKKNATRQNLAREKLIKGIIELKKFSEDRLIVVRGKESDEPHTEFWLVPPGADKPDFDEAKWDLTFSTTQKPFIHYASEWDVLCPYGGIMKIYSEYLTENPKARANIVIHAKSKAEFQKQKAEFSDELTEKYKISPKRIRYFFVKRKSDSESYELWLLP